MEYINFIKKISLEAGESLLSNYKIVRNGKVKTVKGDIYTKADLESEKIIISAIKEKFPDHKILSEESGLTGNLRNNNEYTWLVDPLDGTSNFAAGISLWGTSIALLKGNKLIVSAIYLPVLNELYWAEKGKGSFLGDSKISVNKEKDFYNFIFSCKGVARQKDDHQKILGLFKNFVKFSNSPRIFGSVVVVLTHIASGSISINLSWKLSPWDVAAGILLVEEAGGKVTDLFGNLYNLEEKYVSILATNGYLHNDAINKVIKPLLAP